MPIRLLWKLWKTIQSLKYWPFFAIVETFFVCGRKSKRFFLRDKRQLLFLLKKKLTWNNVWSHLKYLKVVFQHTSVVNRQIARICSLHNSATQHISWCHSKRIWMPTHFTHEISWNNSFTREPTRTKNINSQEEVVGV